MRKLNYKHLHYFWCIAREGSISRAAEQLHLTPQTLSGQLKTFEEALSVTLFNRQHRSLTLTSIGREVMEYADEIFNLGKDLEQMLNSDRGNHQRRLTVGITDAMPKLLIHALLEPLIKDREGLRLIVHEGAYPDLMSRLEQHRIDVMIADSPATPSIDHRLHNQRLGESTISMFAAPALAKEYRENFPQSLNGAPLLLPTKYSSVREQLDHWFQNLQIQPLIRGEFDDQALIKTFAQAGNGLFSAPTVLADTICEHYRVEWIGDISSIQTGFYAITSEQQIGHSTISKLYESATYWFSQHQ